MRYVPIYHPPAGCHYELKVASPMSLCRQSNSNARTPFTEPARWESDHGGDAVAAAGLGQLQGRASDGSAAHVKLQNFRITAPRPAATMPMQTLHSLCLYANTYFLLNIYNILHIIDGILHTLYVVPCLFAAFYALLP